MQLDLDPVREVFARFVEHHMPARHQKQALITLEEKATRIRQHPLLFECVDDVRW